MQLLLKELGLRKHVWVEVIDVDDLAAVLISLLAVDIFALLLPIFFLVVSQLHLAIREHLLSVLVVELVSHVLQSVVSLSLLLALLAAALLSP